MVGFITKSGSTYIVDAVNKTVSGGALETPTKYVTARIIMGERAEIELVDGRVMSTNTVVKYL